MRGWFVAGWIAVTGTAAAAEQPGYFRRPALHGETVVFVAEGDLWRVPISGGRAERLTVHPAAEDRPAISPDGKRLVFSARYEGPEEVYVMPLDGGRPRRLTFDAARLSHVGWTPDGKVLVGTDADSGLPNQQLVVLDDSAADGSVNRTRVPLAQAADGAWSVDAQGKADTLFFTRLAFQGSRTKRYRGGTVQQLWSFRPGDADAIPRTADHLGTSKEPIPWNGRVYFLSDLNGTMNLVSLKPDGTDERKHTSHDDFDIASFSLRAGKVVYRQGADLRSLELASGADRLIEIRLVSDFDQTREKWIKEPLEFLTDAHPSPDGSQVVVTARGRVFVLPRKGGRLVEAARTPGVRYRDARFMPDGKRLLLFSDASGEVELETVPADGLGEPKRLTHDGTVLRRGAMPSPDGKFVAHFDKNHRLFLLDVSAGKNKQIAESTPDEFEDLAWSPDSKWLVYVETGDNLFRRVFLHSTVTGKTLPATTDRYASFSPTFAPDGKRLYLLSDRHLKSVVPSPWGTYQPEPFLDKKTKLYQLSLVPGLKSPFAAPTELDPPPPAKSKPRTPIAGEAEGAATFDADDEDTDEKENEKAPAKREPAEPAPASKPPATTTIEAEGLLGRLVPLPIPPGNYDDLAVNGKALFWRSFAAGERLESTLQAIELGPDEAEVKTVAEKVTRFELSADGTKLLILKAKEIHLADAVPDKPDPKKSLVDLAPWNFTVDPREEWRQMFAEAWRLERDHFYDRGMHGNDWPAVRKKYEPLLLRVTDREELNDLIGEMVSELGALHIFIRPGDVRKGADSILPARLGADFVRDGKGGGFRVERVLAHDPDEPERAGPLSRPGGEVVAGEILTAIDGVPTLSAVDLGELLRGKADRQVLLTVRAAGGGERKVVVKPHSPDADRDLRYHAWEYERRRETERLGNGEIGYVHLRAMGGEDFGAWARAFYPVYTKGGLIVDVRHNRGGNIDSWLIARLLRKATLFWNQRIGRQNLWNMQYAFRGHIVVLCNERTASDGEFFCESVRRHKLGTILGTRTWGGGIWLSSDNFLLDKGIATAAEYGVFDLRGLWVVEGPGVEPDQKVDNLPHSAFRGEDAQLAAAVRLLKKKMQDEPVVLPPVPPFPKP